MATFYHRNYSLVNNDRIVRNSNAPPLTAAEDEEVIQLLAKYVENRIITEHNFVSIQIPEDADPCTSILASSNWMKASKILIIIQNSYGSQLGIVSRSITLDHGITKGTWIPYLEKAQAAGYAVLLLSPNTNSVSIEVKGEKPYKMPIKGSESPEIHALYVWENIVPLAENASHIALLGYGNGASLCKDLFLRQMVQKDDRIRAFVTIEASHIIEKDDATDIKDALGRIAINMESNSAVKGYRLAYRKEALGCSSFSVGLPPGVTEVKNVATSVSLGMDDVFRYLSIAEAGNAVSKNFAQAMAKDNGLDYTTAVVMINPSSSADDDLTPLPPSGKVEPPKSPEKVGFFSRIFGSSKSQSANSSNKSGDSDEKLTVTDFDLLKIVGKGAFGKVSPSSDHNYSTI